jgi:hypothetical protein
MKLLTIKLYKYPIKTHDNQSSFSYDQIHSKLKVEVYNQIVPYGRGMVYFNIIYIRPPNFLP